jgi:hypothetical protein
MPEQVQAGDRVKVSAMRWIHVDHRGQLGTAVSGAGDGFWRVDLDNGWKLLLRDNEFEKVSVAIG